MKKLLAILALGIAFISSANAASSIDAKQALFNTGKIFVGAEMGIGSAWYPDFSIGVTAGYQHYFKEEWQFYKFRHGVRGYGNLAYVYDNDKHNGRTFHNNGFHLRAGADWTLEFTPLDSTIWGVYTGLSVGVIHTNARYYNTHFGYAWHIGGSVNIANTHRIDVGLEAGLFSILSIRYLYMF